MNTDTTLLQRIDELSARVVALEIENRLLRQKLDQYIRHYFGGHRANFRYAFSVFEFESE